MRVYRRYTHKIYKNKTENKNSKIFFLGFFSKKKTHIYNSGEKYTHSNQLHHSSNLSTRSSHINTMYTSRNSYSTLMTFVYNLSPQLRIMYTSTLGRLMCFRYDKVNSIHVQIKQTIIGLTRFSILYH